MSYPARLLGATVVIGTATLIQWLITPIIANPMYVIFLAAVAICSLVFERKMGLYALILSSFIIYFLFQVPRFGLEVSVQQAAIFAVFVVTSLVMIVIGEAFRALTNALNDADDEKAVLLRELRHRTRNNMQIVSATVGLEAADATEADTKNRLERVSQRIAGLGRISNALDTPAVHGLFDTHHYLEELVSQIAMSLVGERPISVTCQADPVIVKRDTAELLGIVVNELITNAVKHAFPEGDAGRVFVRLARTPDSSMELSVSDDGVGCAQEILSGTGLGLVSGLVGLHGGSIEAISTEPGCKVVVRLWEETDAPLRGS